MSLEVASVGPGSPGADAVLRIVDASFPERERYSGKPLGPEVLAVDSQRLLDHGELITLRTHTRFAAFPAHTHNH